MAAIAFFGAFVSNAAAGPVLAAGEKLYVIRTQHFDIIFPDASRPSALRLSTMADSVYDEVAGKLESRPAKRIPVVITPDLGVFNGYENPDPYTHIVLYDTSSDIGWTAYSDNLRGLFLHELTHAISLQIKAPWAAFFSGIFGSWVVPGLLHSPAFMVEGVTVSFESADGATGRANDPLVKQRLRQDILENKFKTPLEASALYDEFPGGNIYYEYGGLFSSYLQKTYGMEKYAELWRAMGNLFFWASFDPYDEGFYVAFKKVYGLPFLKAWASFKNSLTITGVADAPEILWPALDAKEGRAYLADGMVSDGERLYWVDARTKRAMAMDAASGAREALFDADSNCSISDAKQGRLLVSRAISLPDGRNSVETLAYDLGSRRFDESMKAADMREARFFRSGWIGIVSKLHNTDLVYATKEGSKTLLSGAESLMYSKPAVMGDGRVALIVAVSGKRSIGFLDLDSGKLELVRPRGADAGALDYVRQIAADGGNLYFNYDSDDRLYKLGEIEGAALRLDETDYSGGVLSPCVAGGRVYYVGRFSEGDRVCRYPEASEQASRMATYSLEAYDPAPVLEAAAATVAAAAQSTKVESYNPIDYASPFHEWYPTAVIGQNYFRPTAVFLFGDPMDTRTATLSLGYDPAYPFANAGVSWSDTQLPVALSGSLSDSLVYGSGGAVQRQNSGSLAGVLSLPVFPSPRGAVVGLGGTLLGRETGSNNSPYTWGFSGWNASASATLGWYGRVFGAAKSTSRGFDILSYHDFELRTLSYKTEEHLIAAYDSVPLRLDLWGAWSDKSLIKLDATSEVFSSDRHPAYAEYATLDIASSNYLVEGTLAYRLIDQGIHTNLFFVYANRALFDIGCRGAYFNDTAYSSVFARASLDLGAAMGELIAQMRLFGEGYACLNEGLSDSQRFGWRIGLQASSDAGTSMRRTSFSDLERQD